ncbi:MAG: Gfo/Idh/MocA family oxidoreductase [Planctomycetes bacterium]|nr:Gfo/Idh/MocA family oxidoreductase [Planctomycetota bacterium]
MHTVGVIGLGNIAAMYSTPDNAAPYCHVGGVRHSKHVRLDCVCDLSKEVTQKFRDRWGSSFPELHYAESVDAMLAARRPDIVAVCVRGPHHFAVTTQVLNHANPPRAIFLEKPPTCSLQEMDQLLALSKSKRIPIVVSYSRHWSPKVMRMKELIDQGLIGKVQRVVGYVHNTFLSFASHTTDQVCQFAGYCPTAVFARGVVPKAEVPPGFEPEPEMRSMVIEMANGVTAIQSGDGEYGGFYVDVFGDKGYARAGIYLPPYARDKEGKAIDLNALGFPPEISVFTVAYDQIARHLDGGPPPDCCDDQWAIVHEIGCAGIESVHTGNRITLPNRARTRKVFANG